MLALTMALGLSACGKPGSTSGTGEDEKITLAIGVPSAANVTDWEAQLITMAAGGEKMSDLFVDANAMTREVKDDSYLANLAAAQ